MMTIKTKAIILAIAGQVFINCPGTLPVSVNDLYTEFVSQCEEDDYYLFIKTIEPFLDLPNYRIVFPDKVILIDDYIAKRAINILF